MINVEHRYRAICDQCGANGPTAGNEYEADAKAEKDGWLTWEGYYFGFHVCPDCRTKINPTMQAEYEARRQ